MQVRRRQKRCCKRKHVENDAQKTAPGSPPTIYRHPYYNITVRSLNTAKKFLCSFISLSRTSSVRENHSRISSSNCKRTVVRPPARENVSTRHSLEPAPTFVLISYSEEDNDATAFSGCASSSWSLINALLRLVSTGVCCLSRMRLPTFWSMVGWVEARFCGGVWMTQSTQLRSCFPPLSSTTRRRPRSTASRSKDAVAHACALAEEKNCSFYFVHVILSCHTIYFVHVILSFQILILNTGM